MTPEKINVKSGIIAWCTCGLSTNMPYCTGNHTTTDKKPFIEKIDKDRDFFICKCNKTANAPFCDGSHVMPDEDDDKKI